MKCPITVKRALATGLLTLAIAAPVQALEVTGGFSGWWSHTEHENHGMLLSVSGLDGGEKTGAIYWAIYDDAGNPTWLYAQGPIVGDTIDAELFQVEGVTFLQPRDPDNNPVDPVGTMQITFDSCGTGDVDFNTPQVVVGTGGFPIHRVTQSFGTQCSGGIVDDIPPSAVPEDFELDLFPTGVYPEASGDARFEQRPDRIRFDVEIEDVPVGAYELRVGGTVRGVIQVVNTATGPEGEIHFRSPVSAGTFLLDFDPRGQAIDVLENGTVILTASAPDQGTPPGGGGSATPPPFGDSEVEVNFNNSGVYPAGYGDVELEQEPSRVDFDVEIEDVPLGEYRLVVGGIERATIQVVNTVSGPEGEVEFRYPGEAGKLLLGFDPRGELVEVYEGSTQIFSVTFPAGGAGGGDGGGGGGDDGGGDDGGGGGDDNPPPTGEFEIEVDFNNDGVYPAGDGDVDYRQRTDRIDFKVEIEDVPLGDYRLVVGGVERAIIEVVSTVDGPEGEVEFRDPVEPGKLLLDFDPLGELVEVYEGNTRIFHVTMPSG